MSKIKKDVPYYKNDSSAESAYWFIEEFGNVQTLAELCRIGRADTDDIDRIFWMGRRLRGMLKENEYLKNVLDEERAFNIKISEIAKKFEDAFKASKICTVKSTPNCSGVCDNVYDDIRKIVDELEVAVRSHKKIPPRTRLYSKTTKLVIFFVNIVNTLETKFLNLLKKGSKNE